MKQLKFNLIFETSESLENILVDYIYGLSDNSVITDDFIDLIHYKTTSITDRLWQLKSELAKKVKNED